MFGENFTTEGVSESDLHIGDRMRIGSAILMVRQTRTPCLKLAVKFQRDDMLERFLVSERSGFYFSVEQEGQVEAGQSFEFVSQDPGAITIADMNRIIAKERYNRALLERAVATSALPDQWRDLFSQRLEALSIQST